VKLLLSTKGNPMRPGIMTRIALLGAVLAVSSLALANEQDDWRTFFHRLEGQWKGHGTISYSGGYQPYELVAEVASDGADTWTQYLEKRYGGGASTEQNTFWIAGKILRIDLQSYPGMVSLEFSGPDHLSWWTESHDINGNVRVLTQLQLDKKGRLGCTIDVNLNGMPVQREYWDATRVK
jgi:hypothetical protein